MSDGSMDWEQIVRENAQSMLRLAIRIVRSSADAEDLVQEAFLKAYQYQQRENVNSWGGLLHRFVVNAALDHLRKRRTTVSLPENSLANSVENPAQLANMREAIDQLHSEIGKLPRQQSEVFCLADLGGKSNCQIAESLSIRESAVATALHKARRKLMASMTRFLIREEI